MTEREAVSIALLLEERGEDPTPEAIRRAWEELRMLEEVRKARERAASQAAHGAGQDKGEVMTWDEMVDAGLRQLAKAERKPLREFREWYEAERSRRLCQELAYRGRVSRSDPWPPAWAGWEEKKG